MTESSPRTAPCGSWRSPITAETVTAGSVGVSELRFFGNALYWLERRPDEGGRSTIVRHEDGQSQDVLPPPWNARSRVHEYGGGVYCVGDDGVYFSSDEDRQIHILDAEGCRPVTRAPELRFADLVYDTHRQRILCVCEDHSGAQTGPVSSLVSIDPATGTMHTLQRGHDFYAAPRLSHAGDRLCWLSWDHPNMPWDGTRLMLADIDDDGLPRNIACIDGGDSVSICQPVWSPLDRLCYVSDRSGWWNLYLHDDEPVALTNLESEFGLPQWVFGQSSFAFRDEHTLVCSHTQGSIRTLSRLDIRQPRLHTIEVASEYVDFTDLCAHDGNTYMVAHSSRDFPQIIRVGADDAVDTAVSLPGAAPPDECLSAGQPIEFTSRHGDRVHAFHYPPTNPDFIPRAGEQPPLIVLSHGGPTGMAGNALDLRKQFWTSRGFAIVDVNYSGSSGFGRGYRERLDGRWGERDVSDVCDAARHLADTGRADQDRLIIRGSSAGGLTVLAALVFHDVFSAGACYYGISELETLVKDTHKFESCYLDRLVGRWPDAEERYRQRSPLLHVDRLEKPVIFFQGMQDRVVPPSQSEKMVAALDRKGLPVSYVTFAQEAHGFRAADTIRRCLEAELWFYSRIFGFEPADDIDPVAIRNL